MNIYLPKSMNWQEYIHSDSEILLGKPTVKGTRLSVEFLLGLFAAGWTQQQVFDNYPTLTSEALRAVGYDINNFSNFRSPTSLRSRGSRYLLKVTSQINEFANLETLKGKPFHFLQQLPDFHNLFAWVL